MLHCLSVFLLFPILVAFSPPSRLRKSVLDDDPCLDGTPISDPTAVHFPRRYTNVSRPWAKEGLHPRIITSVGLQYHWSWTESLPIRGLTPSTTIGDVIRKLDSLNCLVLVTGPSVWQTIHKTKPLSITGETSCSLPMLYSWCLANFAASSCGLYPLVKEGKYRLEIGNAKINASIEELRAEPLQLFEWGSWLGAPKVNWTSSLDGMAIYDNQAGQIYLIDLAGRGYSDVCEKKISPAVGQDLWEKWADAPLDKLLQFYQLRWQGYSPSSSNFESFINRLVRERFSKEAIQTFYCENLLGGVVNNVGTGITTTCHLVFPDDGHRNRISQARETLEHELGQFFKETFDPACNEMEAVFLTQQQFVDVRNRLKKRIYSPPPTEELPHLVLGEPLVGDISEVHRRPILSKSEAITDLPPDFPSVPRATPDGNGGFKDGPQLGHQNILQHDEPDGAGGGFQHETYGAGEENLGDDPEDSDDLDDDPPEDGNSSHPERREAPNDYGFPGTSPSPSSCPFLLFISFLLLFFFS